MPTLRAAFQLSLSLLILATFGSSARAAQEADWPRWRGAHCDDASRATDVFGKHVELRTRWKKSIGSGYSAVSVLGDFAVTLASADGFDFVIALDADTGDERWRQSIDAAFAGKDGANDGPVSTPTLTADAVYALGPNGQLLALELTTGALRWSVDLVEAVEARRPHWGFTTAPLVYEDLVIVEAGGPAGRAFAAFDAGTGELAWTAGTDRIEYQSPILATLGGREQIVCAGDTFAFGLDPRSGEVLWRMRHGGTDFYAKIIQPLVIDGEVLIKHRQTNAKLLAFGPAEAGYPVEKLWESRHINSNYQLPVAFDGHLYGYSGSFLTCVDLAFGERVWRSRPPGNGWTNLVDEHLVILTKAGSLHVVRATPEEYDERASLQLFDRLTWTPPSFANGRIFARDSFSEIACVDVVAPETVATGTSAPEGSGLIAELEKRIAESDDAPAVVTAFLESQASFPVVEDGTRAHFFYRGAAEDVVVRGDLCNADATLAMRPVAGTDLFHASLELLPEARIGYQFVRDLEQVELDPLNPAQSPSLRFGPSSVLRMPRAIDPAEPPHTPATERGSTRSFTLELPTIQVGRLNFGGARTVEVYLPFGYDEGDERYPVLFVNDAKNAVDALGMRDALDAWIARTKRPLIAVFVTSTSAYEFARSQRHEYRRMLVESVVPHVDENFRTSRDPERRGIFGFDEGAYASLLIALTHPDLFGVVGAQSVYLGSMQDEAEVVELIEKSDDLPRFVLHFGTYDTRDPVRSIDTPRFHRDLARRLGLRGARVDGGEHPDGGLFDLWRERLPSLFDAVTGSVGTSTGG